MDLIITDPVSLDVGVDLVLMVAVVAERVEDRSERQMREAARDLLGRDAEAPVFDDGPHRRSRPLDDRLAAEDLRVCDDVAMFGCGRHLALSTGTALAGRRRYDTAFDEGRATR